MLTSDVCRTLSRHYETPFCLLVIDDIVASRDVRPPKDSGGDTKPVAQSEVKPENDSKEPGSSIDEPDGKR